MRVLVLGASGMLGHVACHVLREGHDVWGTVRHGSEAAPGPLASFLEPDRTVHGVDAHDLASVGAAIEACDADWVINCIGVVKQAPAANDPVESITINSLFPRSLARLCREFDARLIHFGTDCVFSGERGGYSQDDVPDPVDLYGRSKLLGETDEGEALTLRTSVVGRELRDHRGFFAWILANRGGAVRGFDRAIYSGLTTTALSRVIDRLITGHPDLTGTWQVASTPVSKFWLITELNRRLDLGMTVERDTAFVLDRSLDGSAFLARTGIEVPSWEEMLDEFVADQTVYEGLGL